MTISILSMPFPPVNIIAALLSLSFCSLTLCSMYDILFMLFGRTCLRLNSEEISLTWELFSWKSYRSRKSPRQSINKLVYIPKYFSNVPKLCIWSGEEKYQIGAFYGYIMSEVSEAELEWLADELSDWLGLSITNPTVS